MSQRAQSVTDLNRMFYNALLMICWFGAIPLSFMSSPQVQSCDSLMKRSWWKLWDNIIFGGVPYGALRLVHDPARETWPGLIAHSCAAGSVCQLITVCCVRNLAFFSILTWHYPLSANEYNRLLAISKLSFPVWCNCKTERSRKALGHAKTPVNTKLRSTLNIIITCHITKKVAQWERQ